MKNQNIMHHIPTDKGVILTKTFAVISLLGNMIPVVDTVYVEPILHLIQGAAAIVAIYVGLKTLKNMPKKK